MRILMLGWEFPPYISGGLGTACFHLTKALANSGTEVLFVMPHCEKEVQANHVEGLTLKDASRTIIPHYMVADEIYSASQDLFAKNVIFHSVDSSLTPYATKESYAEYAQFPQEFTSSNRHGWTDSSVVALQGGYGSNLMEEVFRYSQAVAALALEEEFDAIHAHDWMTYPAAILVKKLTGKPMVAHIHALECDRSGDALNREVSHIEWNGLYHADKVVAVSNYTKERAMWLYNLPAEKIEVVHNAVDRLQAPAEYRVPDLYKHEKRVLFLGRVTFQKGPEYFVEAARLVLDHMPNVRFIMAGSGDMLTRMMRLVAELRMGSHFHFTGFLRGEEVDHMYALSDLYVMPSVSEPFGISPLEAMLFDIPVIITRQSGVSEVLPRAVQVDFWDVHELANKICAVLAYPVLSAEIVKNCKEELKDIKWANAAIHLNSLYNLLVGVK